MDNAAQLTPEIVHRLAQAAELGDATIGHQRRTSRLAVAVARRLGLPAAARFQLRLAALVHDVGKLAIPRAIIAKPGALTAAERRIVESHTTAGWRLLSTSDVRGFADAAEVALLHHENLDGTGYPLGLAGEAVPFAARLVRVCDAFDALTSDRSYRPGRSPEEALEVVQAGRGREFDGNIVDALVSVVADVTARRRVVGGA